MKVFVQTYTGRVRPINEDSYYLPREGERFCAIADGMGGHNAGEIASAMAVRVFSGEMRMCRWIDGAAMRRSVERANAAVHARSRCVEQYSGMGTTFTALALSDGKAHIAHVGDSRAYRLRCGEMRQISQDHSMVGELVRSGVLTAEQARSHPYRNVITRALGASETIEADVSRLDKQPGDKYLICSDGLSEYVTLPQMESILTCMPLEDAAEEMLARALRGGGRDNISLVIAEVTA